MKETYRPGWRGAGGGPHQAGLRLGPPRPQRPQCRARCRCTEPVRWRARKDGRGGRARSDARRKKHSKYTELFSLREEHRESLVTAWVNVVLQKVLNYSEKKHKKPRRRGSLGQAERRREEGASSERSSLKSGGAL